ncbi:phosphatidylinositol 3,4,5-trisphosphate 3-phosphatase TPTE2-like [Macrotis lagotis]|uniref:phosphatidylinositol 3,4,5-trisphosphate 3-phosphatase TPTE2-like n=1 Tax=Macrotis lagotis TaxID=92651 RepID=UPI003D69E10F
MDNCLQRTKKTFEGNFFRLERFSIFVSEIAQNTSSTTMNLLRTIRSVTLQNKIFPSQSTSERDSTLNFPGKTDDHKDYDNDENELEKTRLKEVIYFVVMSLTFRLFGILLIIIHFILLIATLATSESSELDFIYHIIFLLLYFFYLADVLFQIFLEGVKDYFSSLLNILDFLTTLSILILDIVCIAFDVKGSSKICKLANILTILGFFVIIKVFKLAKTKGDLEKAARTLVSENKRRYKKDGFDLDLTYITDNVIAMSFPSSGRRSIYRNPITEVVRFLDTKHSEHYKIYNLCSECTYKHSYFHNRVERFPIDDHNVPTIMDMLKFVDSVFEWMEKDPKNIIVVHCMGGKGRTGTMISIWLIASEYFKTSKESLEYFGKRRTNTASSSKYQGVETPSQSRYVEYFALIKNKYYWAVPPKKILKVKSITIYSIQGVGKGNGKDMKVIIAMNNKTVYICNCSSSKNCQIYLNNDTNSITIELNDCPYISGDIRVKFSSSSALPQLYEKCAFFFWFNTAFIENNRLYLTRNELDNPHKPKTWHIYREDFAVELWF